MYYNGNTDLLGGDCSSTVSTMTVTVNVLIILRNRLAPSRPTLEFLMVNVYACIDNIHVDALSSNFLVLVALECAEGKLCTMTDPRKTLNYAVRKGSRER